MLRYHRLGFAFETMAKGITRQNFRATSKNASILKPSTNLRTEVRLASGSSSTPPLQNNTLPSNRTNATNTLHQKAARASELHAELNALLDANAQRRADESNRPFGAGFVAFIKKSKSEIINIFAVFACVVLAYQVSCMQLGARLLFEDKNNIENRARDLKDKLRLLSSQQFENDVAELCCSAMKERHRCDSDGKELFGWLRGKSESDKIMNGDELNNVIRNVLHVEIQNIVGDAALTDLEMKEKRVHELKLATGLREGNKNTVHVVSKEEKARPVDGQEDLWREVLNEDENDSGSRVMKRSRGFI